MLVTNQSSADIYFGPLHLAGGVGQTLTVDDTSATSLYLLDDSVADALNTGVPQLLHGNGDPEGIVYAPQGSTYMRRDGTGANNLYVKTTGASRSAPAGR